MDVKIRVIRRITESHIDALYEAMEERILERLEASELSCLQVSGPPCKTVCRDCSDGNAPVAHATAVWAWRACEQYALDHQSWQTS